MFVHRDDPLILEVGAHHGEDSRQFLQVFANCCVKPWGVTRDAPSMHVPWLVRVA